MQWLVENGILLLPLVVFAALFAFRSRTAQGGACCGNLQPGAGNTRPGKE